jgi:hypothetical protein
VIQKVRPKALPVVKSRHGQRHPEVTVEEAKNASAASLRGAASDGAAWLGAAAARHFEKGMFGNSIQWVAMVLVVTGFISDLAVADSEIMINITRIYVREVKYLDFRHFFQ